MTKQRRVDKRLFKCTLCGLEQYAPCRIGHRSYAGHIKHMYCINCRERTEHRQIDGSYMKGGSKEPGELPAS